MTSYRVTVVHDACTTHDVDAESEQAAMEAAMGEAGISLCHQCSREVEMGDPIRVAVIEDLETGNVNDDPDPDAEVIALRAQVAAMQAERSAIIAARDTMGNLWASAKAERDALRADAERYRWLREHGDRGCSEEDGYGGTTLRMGEDLDAAIDAARGAQGGSDAR